MCDTSSGEHIKIQTRTCRITRSPSAILHHLVYPEHEMSAMEGACSFTCEVEPRLSRASHDAARSTDSVTKVVCRWPALNCSNISDDIGTLLPHAHLSPCRQPMNFGYRPQTVEPSASNRHSSQRKESSMVHTAVPE